MSEFFDYGPLTAADDDEFFDAPAGSLLLKGGAPQFGKVGDGWDWRSSQEVLVQSGEVWASLFPSGNPFEGDIDPGWVLRVPYSWAESYLNLAANYAEAEAQAEARVAALFDGSLS